MSQTSISIRIFIYLSLALLISQLSLTTSSSQMIQVIGEPASGQSSLQQPIETAEQPRSGQTISADHYIYLPLVTKPPILSETEQAVLDIVNTERGNAGCDPLTANKLLATAARNHSQDMVDNRFFSHTGSDNSSAGQRITRVGYAYSWWGENIAAGQSTPASVMNSWMNSDGHRENILNCAFTEIGIGYAYGSSTMYGHYWTQVFARPN